MTLAEVLARFPDARRSGDRWIARTPGREDKHPSLSICEREGRVLLHDFSGFPTERVLAAVGLRWVDLFTDAAPPRPRPPLPPGLTWIEAQEVQRARRAQAKVERYHRAFELADEVREAERDVAELRRLAGTLGDTDEAWELLGLAADLERAARMVELSWTEALKGACR